MSSVLPASSARQISDNVIWTSLVFRSPFSRAFLMENVCIWFQKLCQSRVRRLILLLGMLGCTVLVFHTFTLPYKTASPLSFSSDIENSTLEIFREVADNDTFESRTELDQVNETEQSEYQHGDVSDLDEEENPDKESSINLGNGIALQKVKDPNGNFSTLVKVNKSDVASFDMFEGTDEGHGLAAVRDGYPATTDDAVLQKFEIRSPSSRSSSPKDTQPPLMSSYFKENTQNVDMNSSSPAMNSYFKDSSTNQSETEVAAQKDSSELSQTNPITSIVNNAATSYPKQKGKKKKKPLPPKSMLEINELLIKARRSYRVVRPRWYSARDRQLMAIKSQIDHPPVSKKNPGLYEPAFRNISTFQRSYELMEQTLKVYVYKEGKRPIFHQPLLKGIYASEGWFMKHMERSRRYTVKDPRKAHLFYMPFSSRLLQFSLYVPNSHNRTNLRRHLHDYIDTIAAKHPFWNRTFGTDHFLVACHDWAPYETRHAMGRSIRALCNADLSEDFKLGKDVSLPETYVRSGRNPLRDLGGKPAKERSILAFYAGSMHGNLRSVLVQQWANKDPDMKIYGPMPRGVKRKMTYIQHMKKAKYCICPRGYEVNSPRVVESIFYECVPVIISDNYVPPFFELLNWDAFAVFVAEADIPRLKEILLSISEEKYLSLQKGVRKVQRHFIWHLKPLRYDLFHMILHSIWHNRLYTLKPR